MIKKYKMESTAYEMWKEQNEAQVEEFRYGTLIDNELFSCKNGMAILFERYQNCWTSCYEVWFARSKKDIHALENYWYDFCEKYDKKAEEEERKYSERYAYA